MNKDTSQQRLIKGLLAGFVAGVIATAAKSLAERMYPPRTHGESEPPDVLAEKIAGHPLHDSAKEIASETIHWGFGALTGAVYGAVAEFYPAVTTKGGATFGLTLMSLTHETALPAVGLSAPAEEQTAREHTSEAGTHILYGVVAERVRRFVRERLE